MIEVHQPAERVVLVGVPRRGSRDALQTENHLDELEHLSHTAGAEVVGRLIQKVAAPNARYFLGPGKVRELGSLVAATGATLVIFDEDLSPGQGKSLEQALEIRVMDRAELILDIFASRAKSKAAKLQVELALLEHLLPRLARMWVHLSRIRGGIGLRGPGEKQIETDRRMIRRKISKLKRQLRAVVRHRDVLRAKRSDHVLRVALVGYTNAGKSSLLAALTGAQTLIEDRLFATLDTLTRETAFPNRGAAAEWPRQGPPHIRLVDTVGFIRKLPHHLVASFQATLEAAARADVLLHVIDASHPDWEEHVDVVNGVLEGLDLGHTEIVHVFNKMDRVREPDFRERIEERVCCTAFVSAATGDLAELKGLLEGFATTAQAGGHDTRG